MIFKRRLSTVFLVLLCTVFATTSDDFKFDSDDLQIVYSDPPETVMKPPSRYLYAKEIAQCPMGESKMMLTLLLQSLRWSDVSERKKEKAIKKLSRFFLVPRQFITVSDIQTPEILEMLKHSINKSNNLLNTKDAIGRIEFMIGCGEKMFANGKQIALQINENIKDGLLDELSGLPIGWWNIWSKHVKSRVQRTKRQAEGSGNNEEDDYDYEENDDFDEDAEESEDENNNNKPPISAFSPPIVAETPRVRHNQLEDEITERMSTTHIAHETTTIHIPITVTYPTTTTEIITTSEPSTTTTLNLVDATLAVDKTTSANEIAEEDEDEEGVAEKLPEQKTKLEKEGPEEESESNYDNEYDDELPDEDVNSVDVEASPSTTASTTSTTTTTTVATKPTTTTSPTTTEQEVETSPPTTQAPTLPSTIDIVTEGPYLTYTSEPPNEVDYEDANIKPRVDRRIPKTAVTAGKPFSIKVEENVFYDEEDKTNLDLELLSKNGQSISSSSWIRFDKKTREIYGLPLETDVSKYEFKLRATDSAGEFVDENVEITVQQHKGYRSANHELFIQVKLEKNFESPVDWEIRLVRGIVEALGDDSLAAVVVRDIRPNKHEPKLITFVYTNDTLPKDYCPKVELDQLMDRLKKQALNAALEQEIIVRNVNKEMVGSCQERTPPKVIPSNTNTKNFPPSVPNPVDRVVAYAGQLLVFEVPKDTFYDPEDQTDLTMTLLNEDRSKLDPNHWLQFDPKNREFFGVPTINDKSQQYILVAQDKQGLQTNDALIVEVNVDKFKRDYSATFEYQIDMAEDQFKKADNKRKFIEAIAKVFGDQNTNNILLKIVKRLNYSGRTSVLLQNTTLLNGVQGCPTAKIEKLRNVLLRQDRSVRDEVKTILTSEFPISQISVSPTKTCHGGDSFHHAQDPTTPRPDDHETPIINQDVLITYVLPTAIILLMLLIALIIACLLYKRRNTGKMELGDEEERKSFRSKGIPVIFQDELEEKPEILTKSPVILKDEKPPLLPQYNGMSQDGDEDNMDQYIPPQPLMMGSRESRGKSPVTPSYRKPPPYVSP